MTENYPPFRYYVCPTCDKDNEMDQAQLIQHLADFHQITVTKKTKASKEMILHMNKKPRHMGTYEWTFDEGLKIYEYYG